jgi:hypothetical protein
VRSGLICIRSGSHAWTTWLNFPKLLFRSTYRAVHKHMQRCIHAYSFLKMIRRYIWHFLWDVHVQHGQLSLCVNWKENQNRPEGTWQLRLAVLLLQLWSTGIYCIKRTRVLCYNSVIIHIISYNSEPEQGLTQFNYNSHIETHKYNYIIMFMNYIMHIKFTCSYKLNIYNIYSKSYTKIHSKLALFLLRLFAGLLSPVIFFLPFSINIMSQCGVVRLQLLKFFLDIS